jgi:hypothetical protein
MEKTMKRTFALIWLAACGACPGTVATAASSGSVMLTPGIHTTAEISRRCQDYTYARVRDTTQDTSRRAVFLACVQRLSRNENIGAPGVYATGPGFMEAPVSLPSYGMGPTGYGCSTDEGYGRRGSCDNI